VTSALDPRLPPALPLDDAGAVVTVGTFDGVHRGHRQVLQEIVARAARSGRRSVLVTFHPHPLRIVRPEIAPPLLTTAQEKKELLSESGIEYAVFLPFTRALQEYPARRFVEEILLGRMGMRELVIGYDHGFGKDREGGVETLRSLGAELGFAVDVVEAVRGDAEAVSSTRIRRALASGDVEAAATGLGRRYELRGPVVRGERLGRRLGYPTANVRILDPEKMLPEEGVYAVFGVVRGDRVPGLLHLGPRPTFQGLPPSVELHLLDWSGDLYGAELRVEFVRRIRRIEAFRGAEALMDAMRRDEEVGRSILATVER
jgi:riboflavin kinase / FMN adenylyltransferase